MDNVRFLLLQIRDTNDPMRQQEVECFARILRCNSQNIRVHDLLRGAPAAACLDATQVVLLGGSGDYSAAGAGSWLDRAIDVLRGLHEHCKPTFASCWGFQAMARALGGRVVHDLERAELGTLPIHLTAAAMDDPVFGRAPRSFLAHMGHEDRVADLPEDAIRLAFSDRVEHQAFRFAGRPIYCTQFHPELDRQGLMQRVDAYPKYLRKIAGISLDEFSQACQDTPDANELLPRFVQHIVSDW